MVLKPRKRNNVIIIDIIRIKINMIQKPNNKNKYLQFSFKIIKTKMKLKMYKEVDYYKN